MWALRMVWNKCQPWKWYYRPEILIQVIIITPSRVSCLPIFALLGFLKRHKHLNTETNATAPKRLFILNLSYLFNNTIDGCDNFSKERLIIPPIGGLYVLSCHNADISSQQSMEFICHLKHQNITCVNLLLHSIFIGFTVG